MSDDRTPDPSATVTRLDPGGTGMAAVSDAIERLIRAMRKNGMETLYAAVDGVRVTVEPERLP